MALAAIRRFRNRGRFGKRFIQSMALLTVKAAALQALKAAAGRVLDFDWRALGRAQPVPADGERAEEEPEVVALRRRPCMRRLSMSSGWQ